MASAASPALNVTTNVALTGTSTISNTAPKIGDILTGSFTGTTTGTLTYVWKAGGTQVGTNSDTYTVLVGDFGKTITLEITSSVEGGSITSTATTAVAKKAAPAAPVVPTLVSKTYNSVTLTANALYEFSKDGTTWQASNVFGSLTANTAYMFYQRISATADTLASATSPVLNVTTNATLIGTSTISNTAPKIGDILTGSLVSGNNTGTLTYVWKANGTQVGTNSATYTVQVGDLGKTITLEITSSVEEGTRTSTATTAVVKKAAPTAPSAPTLVSKTHNSVTLTAKALYEFSKNGTTWQASNVFDSLTASTAYTFYQRIAATTDTLASAASSVLSVTTNAAPSSTPSTPAPLTLTAYGFAEGQNSVWGQGSANGLRFRIEISRDKYSATYVDGKDVPDNQLTVQSGSTIVTLKPSYLRTLSAGTHTLYVSFTDGSYASTTFTITGKANPQTGVDIPEAGAVGNLNLWIGFIISCITSIIFIVKRLRHKVTR